MSEKTAVFFTFLLLASIYAISLCYYRMWDKAIVGGGDPWGYYVYLPAAFIYCDLDSLHRTVEVRKKYAPGSLNYPDNPLGIGEAHPVAGGRQVIKYTLGIALLEAPFFASAHFLAEPLGFPPDGFSKPYIFSLHWAAFFYAMLGLFFLWKTLRRFFPQKPALFTVAVIALSTNLYYFTVYNSPMAHAFLFCLHSFVLYCTVKWYETPRLKFALLTGWCCGLITLIRPTEIIVLAIPALYGLTSFLSIKNHIGLFQRYALHLALAALVFMLAGLPQLLYWKWTSGHFFFYSYQGEGFHFSTPHIWEGLTSYKNGWLAYTPIMLLALAGIPLLWKQKSPWRWPIAVFLPLHIYLTYSWWCWNYINGFGSRPMIESYALLSFPLALFLVTMSKRRWTLRVTAGVLVFFTWLNLFNTWQFSRGLLWSENANTAYFWRMFGKTSMDYFDLATFESGEQQPDTSRIRPSRVLYFNDFENPEELNTTGDMAYAGTRSLYIYQENERVGEWKAAIHDLGLQAGDLVRVSVWGYATDSPPSIYQGNVLDCKFLRKGKSRKSRKIRIESKLRNDNFSIWGGNPGYWGEAYFWVKTPPFLRPEDSLQVRVRNLGGHPMYVDNLSVEIWEERQRSD